MPVTQGAKQADKTNWEPHYSETRSLSHAATFPSMMLAATFVMMFVMTICRLRGVVVFWGFRGFRTAKF